MKRAFAILLVALSACRVDGPVVQVPLDLAGPATAWGGSRIALHSPRFASGGLPDVTSGADTLVVTPAGGDSIWVLLPDTNASLLLHARLGEVEDSIAVRAYGLVSSQPGPAVKALPYPWPENDEPTALIVEAGQVKVHNYRTASARTLTATTGWNSCVFVPVVVPSLMDPTQVAAQHACEAPVTVPISAGGMAPDTGASWGEIMVHLGRGRWLLRQEPFGFSVFTRQPGAGFSSTSIPQTDNFAPRSVVVAPGSARIVATFWDGNAAGAPVFDSAGTVAYRLAETSLMAAAFTPTGDSLYVASRDSIKLVAASTGAVLRRSAFAFYPTLEGDLALDPSHDWLYAAGFRDGTVRLDVFDRTTLAAVASLRVPAATLASFPGVGTSSLYRLIVDGSRRRLYLTANYHPTTSVVFEFELMP